MKQNLVFAVAVVIAAALAGIGIYYWFFCRFYVPPEHMAVVTAKSGKTPAAGALLVERGEKGIWREVLPEGRYFLDRQSRGGYFAGWQTLGARRDHCSGQKLSGRMERCAFAGGAPSQSRRVQGGHC